MFSDIRIIAMRLLAGNRPLKAFVDIQLDNIVIRDFRIMQEDGKRPYVKVPFTTYKDAQGQLKFRPIVVLPDEVRGEIDLAILNAYHGEKEKEDAKEKQ